ncbi:MAG: glycosyltransferase family 39 protein [Planctomycetes bacterium]|nr:glycosyltransferase family 39 protein [Planctomycetota bacterium]
MASGGTASGGGRVARAVSWALLALGFGIAFLVVCAREEQMRDLVQRTTKEHRLQEGFVLVAEEALLLGAAVATTFAARARFAETTLEERLGAGLARIGEWRGTPLVLAGVALVVLVAQVLLVRERFAATGDENAYLLQATLFARGKLFVDSPPLREFFDSDHVLNTGRFLAKYPPGWPLLLAPFVALGIAWLAGPLFSAASLLVIHRIGRESFDARTATLATLAVAASPLWLVIGSSYLSHPATFFALSLFVLFGLRVLRGDGGAWAAGAALGIAFLCRPLTAIAIAVPFGLAAVWRAIAAAPRARSSLFAAAGVFAPFVGLYLVYNAMTTGDPFLPGHLVYNPHDRLGFGTGIGGSAATSHTVGRAVSNTARALAIWSMGIVPGGFVLAVMGVARPRSLATWVVGGSSVALFAAQACYHYPLENYYVEALIGLGFLIARGVRRFGPVAATAFLAVIVSAGLFVLLPARDVTLRFECRRDREPIDTARSAPAPAIVFFDSNSIPSHSATFFVRNSPAHDDPVLLARDLGARNAELLARFPDRRAFRYRPDPKGGRGSLEPIR